MEFLNDQDLLFKINDLKSRGYDQIRLSGGTSKDGSYFSSAVPFKYIKETKKIYFAGVPYDSTFFLKKEGTTANKSSNENHEQTALRELFEETGLEGKEENLSLLFEKEKKDYREWREGQKHKQFFYLLETFDESHFFTFDGSNPISAETAAPLWIPARLFTKVIYPGHLGILLKAVKHLKFKNAEYAYALMNL